MGNYRSLTMHYRLIIPDTSLFTPVRTYRYWSSMEIQRPFRIKANPFILNAPSILFPYPSRISTLLFLHLQNSLCETYPIFQSSSWPTCASFHRDMSLKLEKFVLNGGALLFGMGDQVDPKYFNEHLGKSPACSDLSLSISG